MLDILKDYGKAQINTRQVARVLGELLMVYFLRENL